MLDRFAGSEPAIPVQFHEPYVDSAGNVQNATQFGNITLDSVWGQTLKNGFMIMGGIHNDFRTGSNPNLRSDWTIGPELVIGAASPRNGHVAGLIINYTWKFPTRPKGQTLAGQYFYGST